MGIPLAALSIRQPEDPLNEYGKALAIKGAMQNQAYQAQAQPLALQQQQQQISEQQDVIAQRQAVRQAYAQAVQPDEKGQPQINTDVLTKALASSNHGDAIPGILENINKYQKSKADLVEQAQKIQEGAADVNGHAAAAVKAANYDPNVAHTILDTMPNSPQIQQLRQLIDANPAAFKQQIDSAIASSPAQQKMQNEQQVAAIRSGVTPITDKIPQLNQALARRYQVLNPGQPLPADLTLPADSTQKDFDRIDKIMQQTEQAKATQAQNGTVNSMRQQTAALAQESFKLRQQEGGERRSDKSYQFESGQLEKVATPIDALATRLGRLQDTIAQNTPQADALVAPELLSVMSGGQGSGLRMNEAEIARIVGGRSNWETLKASINKWQLDPKAALSITPAQRQQIRDLTQTVAQKITAKQAALQDARNGLIGTDDPEEHKRIVAKARDTMTQIDAGGGTSFSVKAPNGKTYTFKDQQSLDAFKQKAGLQ